MTTTTIFRHFDENVISLEPGQVLFSAGDDGDSMYAVLDGQVDLILGAEVVETAGPDDVFGEMALLAHTLRTATAKARTAARVVAVDEDAFIRQVKLNPFFSLEVMRMLALRLVNTDRVLLALERRALERSGAARE